MKNLKAYWICGRGIDKFTATAYRKDFILENKCDSAVLHITSTNRFAFWINGEIVLYGPKRTHAGFKEYDTIDIAQYLKAGRNSFAVTVVYSPSCAVIDKDALLIQADICCGKQEMSVISDSSWVFKAADWYGTSELILSTYTELQEHFDSTKCPSNWQTEEYPQIPDNAKIQYNPTCWYVDEACGKYKPVTVLGPYYTSPWINLIPRTTPMSQRLSFIPNCVWLGNDSAETYEFKDNLAILFNNKEKSGGVVNICDNSYSNKKNNIFVFDFLKTRTVRPGVVINKLTGNLRIEFYYSIKLYDKPIADRGFGSNKEGFCDSFIPSADNMSWKAVTAKGFRFLIVRIAGEGEVEFTPNCELLEYPFGEVEKPKINSEILNRAWDISAETIRSSTTDYYVDTCWRENALWTFDACVTGKAAFDTFGETVMWKNSMLGIARSIDGFGIPKSLAIPGSNMVLMDQNLIWIIYCLEYYKLTNDIEILKQVYEPIKSLLNYCENCVTSENLYIPPMNSWHYIDWAKINKLPYSLPANALYILANLSASCISNLLKDSESEFLFKKRAENISNACVRFFDKSKGAFLCHIEPKIEIGEYNKFSFKEDDLSGAYQYNIYANCLAIKAKIGTEDMLKSAADFVANGLAPGNGQWCDIGSGAFDLLLSPLIDYDKATEITAYLERILKRAAINNLPTFGETTGTNVYNSAHGWQSNINSLIKKLAENNKV